MGRLFLLSLEGKGNCYTCLYCKTHIALLGSVILKTCRIQSKAAYLFDKVVNVMIGENEDRVMGTELCTVRDVNCVACQSLLGCKVEFASDQSLKHMEGKFLLERLKLLAPGERRGDCRIS